MAAQVRREGRQILSLSLSQIRAETFTVRTIKHFSERKNLASKLYSCQEKATGIRRRE
jgi:hypothetical protein